MRSIVVEVIQGGGMKRSPEDVALSATASGVMLAITAVVALIIYAMFAGASAASPVLSHNLAGLAF